MTQPPIQRPTAEGRPVAMVPTTERIFQSQFSVFRHELTDSMREVADIVARSGPSALLMGLGATLLVLVVFLKFSIFGVNFSTLSPAEFITTSILAFFILIAGAGLKVFQYTVEMKVNDSIRQAGERIMERTQTAATNFIQQGGGPPSTL